GRYDIVLPIQWDGSNCFLDYSITFYLFSLYEIVKYSTCISTTYIYFYRYQISGITAITRLINWIRCEDQVLRAPESSLFVSHDRFIEIDS
ncbi:hypothetical protein ACJX0J_021649, partial [Zea mays]